MGVLVDMDRLVDHDEMTLEEMLDLLGDSRSLIRIAENRALLAAKRAQSRRLLAAIWLDGFIAGARYEEGKTGTDV